MRVALGWKAHSGWAALVVLGEQDGKLHVVDRRRVELVDHEWAKAPYHAAEELEPAAARKLVERGLAAAHRVAARELRAIELAEQERGNIIAACAVLTGEPMPPWSTEEILAVHFRMHKAEGALFRDALAHAARESGLALVAIPEKSLAKEAESALATSMTKLSKQLAALGKSMGPPWGKDQRVAALAALVALRHKRD